MCGPHKSHKRLWERVGEQPGVEGGHTTIHGGWWCSYGLWRRGVRIRGEAGVRVEREGNWATSRGVGRSVRIRLEYQATGERGHLYEVMDRSAGLQESVGALKRAEQVEVFDTETDFSPFASAGR